MPLGTGASTCFLRGILVLLFFNRDDLKYRVQKYLCNNILGPIFPRDKFLLPATKHVLASQKQSAPGKRHKRMFSAEHFIFFLFLEIKQFRGSENMCLRRFKNP
jgi:hypothetical protein